MKSIWIWILAGGMMIGLDSRLAAAKPTTLPSDWTPPVNDAPAKRVGGAARACRTEPGLLASLLAPSGSVGLTAKTQPTLYWYLTQPTRHPIEISLTPLGPGGKDMGAAPVLDVVIPKSEKGGIQSLDLSKPPGNQVPVTLQAGVQYDWVVEIVVHDRNGSDNPTAATRVECIKPSDAVLAARSASLEDQYKADHQEGIWYDMIDALTQMIDANKDNPAPRQTRQALLKGQNLLEDSDGKIVETAKAQ